MQALDLIERKFAALIKFFVQVREMDPIGRIVFSQKMLEKSSQMQPFFC